MSLVFDSRFEYYPNDEAIERALLSAKQIIANDKDPISAKQIVQDFLDELVSVQELITALKTMGYDNVMIYNLAGDIITGKVK